MNIRAVKGMNDIFAPEIYAWRHVETLVRDHFETFGYSEIKTPVAEMTSLFSRGVGETTDIVQKEMYTFADRNNESLSLRPEGTAPVVRALVEHNLFGQEPQLKLYYWGPMFRYERPQKGRYRQFYQFGAEVLGIAEPRIDAEMIAMLYKLFERFGLKGLTVRVSSLGGEESRLKYRETLVSLLTPSKAVLCGDCQKRLEKNPLRILDCKNPTCQEVAAVLPSPLEFLDEASQKHFDQVRDGLVMLNIPFVVDRKLVRGLDYYTSTVFEISSGDLGAQNTVGAGGRYDRLVKELGGPETPAVGFAVGVERLVLLLNQAPETYKPVLPLFIVVPDEKGADIAYKTAFALRLQGVGCELDLTGKSMKSQMKRADKLGAKNVLIIGGSEIDAGHGILRDMTTKNQENISLANLEGELLKKFKSQN